MKVFVCVDDNGGMLFNNRRQSRDQKVVEKIREIVGKEKLWIKEFSKAMFEESVVIDDALLDQAGQGDYCFIENEHLSPYEEKIEEGIFRMAECPKCGLVCAILNRYDEILK